MSFISLNGNFRDSIFDIRGDFMGFISLHDNFRDSIFDIRGELFIYFCFLYIRDSRFEIRGRAFFSFLSSISFEIQK